MRKDSVQGAAVQVVSQLLGPHYIGQIPFALGPAFEDSSPTVPIVFLLCPGSDPMMAIQHLAASKENVNVLGVSLGQGQEAKAERLIRRGVEKGEWIVLQNCHLFPTWMGRLSQLYDEIKSNPVADGFQALADMRTDAFLSRVCPAECGEVDEGAASWAARERSWVFEGDAGVFSGSRWTRLLYSVVFFHAIALERRAYGPIGWNNPYEFSEHDLRISLRQLSGQSEDAELDWAALTYSIGQCNYGGRVTDMNDRRTLEAVLGRCVSTSVMEQPGYRLSSSGAYVCPRASLTAHEDLVKFAEGSLPASERAEVFGLHENAQVTKLRLDSRQLLEACLEDAAARIVRNGRVSRGHRGKGCREHFSLSRFPRA